MDEGQLLMRRQAADPEEMSRICVEFFEEHLSELPAALVLLEGELGAGKTAFCRGFREALGIAEIINSPTFNLLNEYEGLRGKLSHYDLYRLQGSEEADEAGFTEMWEEMPAPGEGIHIHAVEWWRRAEERFPVRAPTFLVRINYNLDNESEMREVTIIRHVGDLSCI